MSKIIFIYPKVPRVTLLHPTYIGLSVHSLTIFGELPPTEFNPIRDVWLPLDFSNAASFNAMLAHTAAHLAHLQGEIDSTEALKYNAEAIGIINQWLIEETSTLGDDIVAAVVRLLVLEVCVQRPEFLTIALLLPSQATL